MSKERRPKSEHDPRNKPDARAIKLITRDQVISRIPAVALAERFNAGTEVKTIVKEFPTLSLELGTVTDKPQALYNHLTGEFDSVHLTTSGSAKFGLINPEDAMLWSGIENHGIGTAFQIEHITSKFINLTRQEKRTVRRIFETNGFNFDEFDEYDPKSLPQLLRDVFFPSHLSRRRYDERRRYKLENQTAHPAGTTGQTAKALLEELNAPPELWHLIKKVEDHDDHMISEIGQKGYFPNILDALLTYSDWTYNQETISLAKRFEGFLTERDDHKRERIMLFQRCGEYFENVFNLAFSAIAKDGKKVDILEELRNRKPTKEEIRIRQAYCAPSGIPIEQAFPKFKI